MIVTFTNDGVASMSASKVDRRFIARVRAVCKRREITAKRSVSLLGAERLSPRALPSNFVGGLDSPSSSCAER